MPTSDTMIAVRVSADLLDQIDQDADRLGLSRSALIRARMSQRDQLDAAAVLQAAQSLHALIGQIDSNQVQSTPLQTAHLHGSAAALNQVATISVH